MVNPRILGVRLDMLMYLYWRRVRAHPMAELLAGAGVAVGVALIFGVLLANASLTSSARQLIRGLAGSARWELVARSSQGMSEGLVQRVGELESVRVAAPVLRENVTLSGPSARQAVQLIGLTPSLEELGGASTQQLAAGAALLKGGVGLPSGVASSLHAHRGTLLVLAGSGQAHSVRVRSIFGAGLTGVAASPVAVAVLPAAQALTGLRGRVSEILIRPVAGQERRAAAQLSSLAGSEHLDLTPADQEVRMLGLATRPNVQSTSLFSAIAVMVGFLLALNAMLLTVPERRRFIAELRMQGYDARQLMLLMLLQACVLGLLASLAGVALGYVLSHAFFERVPGFLTAAFPIGAEESVRPPTVALGVGCGLLASMLASAVPLAELRLRRAPDAALREPALHSETIRAGTLLRMALAGAVLFGAAVALALLWPGLTILAGVALALAAVCFIPAALGAVSWLLPRVAQRLRSSALIVALAELRSITTRTAALAAIVALAVFGGVAIGGARSDLLRGIDRATVQYFSTAQLWVTAGSDVFNTNSFDPRRAQARIARVPGVASVRVYRGGLLDVGSRRMWVRARPARDATVLEPSQLLSGDYARATRLIRMGGWAAVSSDFARERHLRVGSALELPTPSGGARLRVAAITTNSGWPAGSITLSGADFGRLWRTSDAAALEVSLKAGVSAGAGRRAVAAALGAGSGLDVRSAAQRAAQSAASARQGLRTLSEISALLLVAAALAVAAALSAAIWQRRLRLAALKIQGYDAGQLWRAVLLESGVTIGVGALVGALLGLAGHALASRFLSLTTGFPAPFAAGPAQVLLTLALFAAIALAVIALPGMAAARTSPSAALAE